MSWGSPGFFPGTQWLELGSWLSLNPDQPWDAGEVRTRFCVSVSPSAKKGVCRALSPPHSAAPGRGLGSPWRPRLSGGLAAAGHFGFLLSPVSFCDLPMLPLQVGTFPVMSGAAQDSSRPPCLGVR